MAEVLKIDSFERPDAVADPLETLETFPLHSPGLSDEDAYAMALLAAQAADDRKAADITILDVRQVSYLADYFVIMTGFSSAQVRAIARSIEAAIATDWQRQPLHTEGNSEGRWIVQDYGEIIIHIFMPKEREFYDLEAFWGHAQRLPFTPMTPTTPTTPTPAS